MDWPCRDGAGNEHEPGQSEHDATEADGPVNDATGHVSIAGHQVHERTSADDSLGRFDASVPSGAIDAHTGDINGEAD